MKNRLKKIAPYVMLVLPIICINKSLDNDIWFMLNHGRYILQNGFTNIEPFTVHEGLAFSFEKWATCVLFYKIYEIFGGVGIIVFMHIIGAILEYIFYKCVSYISENKLLNIAITSFVCATFYRFFMTSRPQTFSYIFLLLQFLMLEKYIKTNKTKYLFIIPVLSVLYMQFHSTMWPMFMIMFMPYLFDFDAISKRLGARECVYSKKPIIISACASLAVAFINPYGYKSVIYLTKSMGVCNGVIKELAKPTLITFTLIGSITVFLHAIYWLIRVLNKQNNLNKLPLRYIYLLIGTFLMSIYALRNMAYFSLYGGIIAAYMLETINMKAYASKFDVIAIFIAVLGAFALITNGKTVYDSACGKEALDSLKNIVENPSEIKIYTDFDSGGYAEWLGFKAYIDPRAEVFLEKVNSKEDIMNEYIKVYYGQISYDTLQEKYNFKYWSTKKDTAITTYMDKDEKYKKIIETEQYNVYEYIKGGQ